MNDEEMSKAYEALSEKQKRFIDNYIEYADAKKAAAEAGYSEKTAKQIGCENLAKLDRFIKWKMQGFKSDKIASQKEVLEFLTGVMNGTEKDAFGLDASLQDRIKSAELLGKRYGTFVDKKDIAAGGIKVTIVDDVRE